MIGINGTRISLLGGASVGAVSTILRARPGAAEPVLSGNAPTIDLVDPPGGISYVASSDGESPLVDSDPWTFSAPAGIAEDDILLVAIACDGGSVTGPTGFTQAIIHTGSPRAGLWYKMVGSTPDTIIEVNAFDLTRREAACCMAFRGVDPASPIDVAGIKASASTGNPDSPSITTLTDRAIVVSVGANDDDEMSGAPTLAGYSDVTYHTLTEASGSNNAAVAMAWKKLATAGAEDPPGWVFPGVDDAVVGFTFALRPVVPAAADAVVTDVFGASEEGGYWNTSDLSSLFQERTGDSATTPSLVGDVVGTQLDLSGNGNHRIAPSDASRPILRLAAGKYYLEYDGVDDEMFTDSPSYGTDVSEIIVFDPDGDPSYIVSGGQNNSWHDLAINGDAGAGAGNGIGGLSARRVDGVASAAGNRDEVHDEFDAGDAHVLTLENLDLSGWTKHGHFYYENSSFRFAGRYYGGVTLDRDFVGTERADCETYFGGLAGLSL